MVKSMLFKRNNFENMFFVSTILLLRCTIKASLYRTMPATATATITGTVTGETATARSRENKKLRTRTQ